MGVAGALSGEYGADGLGFEDEESSMSVSEFKYAVYSGNVLSEYVEVDEDECVFLDEEEYVFRSVLKCFYVVLFLSGFVLILYSCFSMHFSHSVSKLSSFQHSLSKSKLSFSRIFAKVTLYHFLQEKVDSLFVVLSGNCNYFGSVLGD